LFLTREKNSNHQDKEPRFHRLSNGNKKGSGRSTQIKSLAVRLTGKRGRMRSNIMGKRVNWSSRAVIGPGVGLDANELGVPELVWRTQTVPVRCTALNVHELLTLLRKGEVESVDLVDTKRNKRAKWVKRGDIQVGCVVHRLLQTGDSIVFNRPVCRHAGAVSCRSRPLGPKP